MRTCLPLYFALFFNAGSLQILAEDQRLDQSGNLQGNSPPDCLEPLLAMGGDCVQSGRLNLHWSDDHSESRNACIHDLRSRIWAQFGQIENLPVDHLNLRATRDKMVSQREPNTKGEITC
jgi:hypothetical protein